MSDNDGDFTRAAAAMVAQNDRRVWLRGLTRALRRAAGRTVVAWCAIALAALVVYAVPPYTRFYS